MLAMTLLLLLLAVSAQAYRLLPVSKIEPTGFTTVAHSNNSTLYRVELAGTPYPRAPLALRLRGTRRQIGYDYAALLHAQAAESLNDFITTVLSSKEDQMLLLTFLDFCWTEWLSKHTPQAYLDELEGMRDFHATNPPPAGVASTDLVSHRFYTLANMPADTVNIIAMLEDEFEKGWPAWLKDVVNDIVRILEKFAHGCDAYGVWGNRTEGGALFTSRNLDYQSNTGINKYKLITFFDIDDGAATRRQYATLGFTYGPGALAGQSLSGMTVSEMNLDNSRVTFNGLAFPLRLRYILEQATDLDSAMTIWNSTANTNSFNFLIGSARDGQAYALETIRGFTAVFPANSPVEAAATVDCAGAAGKANHCHKWAPGARGRVQLGKPLPDAVWRTNHGLSPVVMATQEPLFNNTVFRYDLLRALIGGAPAPWSAPGAVALVGTLGTKGADYFACAPPYAGADNILSVAYAPKVGAGELWVAWESGSGAQWKPAACAPYVHFNLTHWF